MRTIDGDALRECYTDLDDNLKVPVAICKANIDSMPTIEAEPVVRCKKCKYYSRVDKRRFYRGSDCLNNHIDTIVPDRDYCSRGERREE